MIMIRIAKLSITYIAYHIICVLRFSNIYKVMKKISVANNVKHIDQSFETKNIWSKIAICKRWIN